MTLLLRIAAVGVLLSVFFVVAALIPPLPDQAVEAFATLIGYAKGMNALVPVNDMITVLGIMLAYEVILRVWNIARWIWGMVGSD